MGHSRAKSVIKFIFNNIFANLDMPLNLEGNLRVTLHEYIYMCRLGQDFQYQTKALITKVQGA